MGGTGKRHRHLRELHGIACRPLADGPLSGYDGINRQGKEQGEDTDNHPQEYHEGPAIGHTDVDGGNGSQDILVVSEKGFGKRSAVDDYRITNRGGKGVKTINITDKTGKLIATAGGTWDAALLQSFSC